GDVGEDVVRDDKIRPAVGRRDLGAGLDAEEGDLRRDAALDRPGGGVRRGLDPERGDAESNRVLKEVTVIAGDFDDERLRPETEAVDRRLDEPFRMLDPGD